MDSNETTTTETTTTETTTETTTNIKIKLDIRERELIPYFKNNENIIFEESTLDIGDIHFYNNDELLIIVERKSLSDLSSSITDGRYKEQKQRLLYAVNTGVRKIYFIEGDDMNSFHLNISIFNSLMLSTVIRDKIMIYRTTNIEDTYNNLKKIYENLPKWINENWDVGVSESIEYSGIKLKKKENVTQNIAFKAMISVIPGLSNSIATVLSEKYHNIENMINSIKEDGIDWESRMKKIGDIQYGINSKRIGDSIAKKILIYFFNLTDEELRIIQDDNFGKKVVKPRKKKEDKNIINLDDTIDINSSKVIPEVLTKNKKYYQNSKIKTKPMKSLFSV